MRVKVILAAFVVLVLGYLAAPSAASVLGIDLSAEYIKVAAVKPGNPFHIIVDEQAKRKVPLAVAFDDGERHFGNNAIGFGIRKPLETYVWYHRLLGQTIDSPRVKALQEIFPYKFVAIPSRGGAVGVQKPNSDEVFTPEELVAMSLQHAMKIARDEDIDTKDAVITVPGWFTPVERQAVIDAAEIAGMTVLGLINDNTASAITYGIDRQYRANETHTALFIDMGSAGLEASVIRFSATTASKGRSKGKSHGQATVLSSAWDADLGGLAFDKTVRDHLVTVFSAKHGAAVEGVTRNPKAMAKLLKQAVASKMVLSANKDVFIRLESVFKDEDLATPLSRAEFYDLAKDLLTRIKEPIFKAVDQSGLKIDALDAVVIIGGSVRIPGVQDEIKSALGRERLDQNINGDEAMAMGAVFRAANVSTLFQARPFGLSDISNFEVQASIAPVVTAGLLGAEEPRFVNLFKKGQALGKRTKIRFYEEKDLLINVAFSDVAASEAPSSPGFSAMQHLTSYKVTGIKQLAEELKEKAEKAEKEGDKKDNQVEDSEDKKHSPRLALSFQLDQSGLVRLVSAEASVEEMADVPNPAFKKLYDARVANATRLFKRASFEFDSAKKALDEAEISLETLEKTFETQDSVVPEETEKAEKAEDEKTESEADSKTVEVTKKVTEDDIKAAKQAIETATTRLTTATEAKDNAKKAREAAMKDDTISEPKTIRQSVARVVPLAVTRIFTDKQLNIASGPSSYVGVDATELARSREVLANLSAADFAKKSRAEAFNSVETAMYAIKNELYEEEFENVTTEDQRNALRELAEAADDWIYGDGASASTEELVAKAQELQKAVAPAKFRKAEAYLRPNAVANARAAITAVQIRATELAAERPWMAEDDKKVIATGIENLTKWLDEISEKQAAVQAFDEPVFSSSDVEAKVEALNETVAKIEKKRKPKADKKAEKKADKKKSKKADKKAEDEEKEKAEATEAEVETDSDADAETETEPTVDETNEVPASANDAEENVETETNSETSESKSSEDKDDKEKSRVHDEL